MSEVAPYSEEGVIQRAEYVSLTRERQLGVFYDASELLEEVFEQAHEIRGLTGVAQASPEGVVREVHIDAHGIDTTNDTLIANTKTNAVFLWGPPRRSVETSVTVRHELFSKGALEEAYTFAVQRTMPGVDNSFFATYTFEFFKGGSVQAAVYTNNIPVEEGEKDYIERPMVEYDVCEFEKEVGQVGVYMNGIQSENTYVEAYRLATE